VTALTVSQGACFCSALCFKPNIERFNSHPHSIDALCALPSSYPSSYRTILTGSSDGLLRAVELFPTRLVGVVADHGEFPIEQIAVDHGGEGHWVGSVGHDEMLRMTDLREIFEDEDEDEGEGEKEENNEEEKEANEGEASDEDDNGEDGAQAAPEKASLKRTKEDSGSEKEVADSDADDSDAAVEETRKKKRKKDKLSGRAPKKDVEGDASFFTGL
jgi:hypothetical protein